MTGITTNQCGDFPLRWWSLWFIWYAIYR